MLSTGTSATRSTRTSPRTRRARRVVAAALAVSGLAVVGPVTAADAATPRNGVCESGEVCFYYLSNYQGSLSDFTSSVSTYGTDPATCYVFKTRGLSGYNACIKNNVQSVWNRSTRAVRVYYNSNYSGASQLIPANSYTNLNTSLRDNNASHKFL
ncbi:peptidase inhibitor family I36 protein [Kineococcus gynurae]|uniref:Peptidase inhibitor family I36 protein n=1 Tax=Kineococcus gynurae TaxID=452979 RepID=A0ABV5LNL7_9ACTN